jgi:rod shape-determining protein MreC
MEDCLSLVCQVGKIITNDLNKDNEVIFFSDFRQLDYVKIVSYEIGSGN